HKPHARQPSRRFGRLPASEQDAKPKPDQKATAHHRQRPPPRHECRCQRGDAERRDGRVKSVRGRDPETRKDAGEPALEKRPPNAQEEDRPGDAAMAKPSAKPRSSRLNTASPHGMTIVERPAPP